MTGPGWLAAGVAALMLLIACSCGSRLLIGWVRGRTAGLEADALHAVMGVAMAGMLEPRLSPAPAAVWRAMFAAAAGWFAWRMISSRRPRRCRSWRCAHPGPHAVECAAMVYMLLPAGASGRAPAMAMSGMTQAGTPNPALALVLALFMLGYILWTSDQLAALSRAGLAGATHSGSGAVAALAPRFAACSKIAMGIAMGYMLVTMV
ncbi:MAG: DUF5134 domain-containing protein [Streptosporangiaceae bacterium]